jgi:type VI secretion system protein ImpC
MDISQEELDEAVTAVEDLQDTWLYKALAAETRRGTEEEPWAVIAGMYSFKKNMKDAVTLGRMGGMGEMLGAPFISAAGGGHVGALAGEDFPGAVKATQATSPTSEKAWQVIRTLPEAVWTGLILPRFLIRLPYGADTDPLDSFDFEEMPAPSRHSDYAWANPVFACLQLMGATFSRHGWDWSAGALQEITALPVHTLKTDAGMSVTPCAEVLLTQQTVEKLAADGFMVLISFKDQDRIRLSRFQSIAVPVARLSGRWR